ncbi:CaiB/BaiF CoA transferase family protein [Faunimonas sp. B44]|uniref:CaiB/BaiF CoA transferase family protein n=1 Tax=Faunimonas sp. B44 TaxID=3461493 RepID=UPI00404443F3
MHLDETPLTPRALEGVRVIDMADTNSVYTTKILCDLGAEVIRIEPTAGDPMRTVQPVDDATGTSAFYAYMNTNKRMVTLDLERPGGADLFRSLVATADIVVESERPGRLSALGLDYASFKAEQPALVWTTVTPFGSSGPWKDWQADDLISQAMGGFMTLSGLPEREPLKLFGEQSCFIAGLHATSGTLIALWHALLSGEGQHVDVSIHEAIVHTLESAIQVYTTEGRVRGRLPRSDEAGIGMFPATDGEIFVYANMNMITRSWFNLVKTLQKEGIPGAEDLSDPKWQDQAFRRTPEAREAATEMIAALTKNKSKYQNYNELQARNVLSAPKSEISDLFNNPQLKFLNWFVDQPIGDRMATWPGPAFRMSETPRRQPGPVRAPGADNDAVLGALGVAGEKLQQSR